MSAGQGGSGLAGAFGFSGGAGSFSTGGSAGAGGSAGTAVAGMGGTQGSIGTSPAKVLCLGDSITEQTASWIYPMQDALRVQRCSYELIGIEEGPYNGPYSVRIGYDNERVAAGGFSTTGILNLIKERGTGGVPDIVVEYLGVNNVYGGFIDGKYNPDNRDDPDGAFIRDNLELLALLRAQNPKLKLLLMKIENHALPEIDAAIDELVATASTAQSPVIAVAVAEGVETEDGIHPTAAGAVTLAGPVGKALGRVLDAEGRCLP